jgi:hypothetical protein
MKNSGGPRQLVIIVAVFTITRILTWLMSLRMSSWPLYAYWQYLDVNTLKNHLLSGIWYDHAQPPVFNLFLGVVLKMGGEQSASLFAAILKLISLANGLLIFSILRRLALSDPWPLITSLAYLISPATLIFECELFYTTTASLFLLISVYFLIRYSDSEKFWNAFGIFFPLTLLCLTRSVYHIVWLLAVVAFLLFYFRRTTSFYRLIFLSLVSIMLVGGWYLKNKIIFGRFTSSTWVGMNMARNVFHDNEIRDSSRIEAYAPFSRISVYRKFLDPHFEDAYKGLNDPDLLMEMKNDSFINETEVSYILVSDLYQQASTKYIRTHPGAFAKNVFQSSILYFTPATVYSLAVEESKKIRNYDLLYSLNWTHFAKNKQQRRVLLTLSAIPKIFLYFLVFFVLIRYYLQNKSISAWNLFIMLTIGFVFGVGSFFEHYENMRFRFETEPLFLILAAQAFSILYYGFKTRRYKRLQNGIIQKESASR